MFKYKFFYSLSFILLISLAFETKSFAQLKVGSEIKSHLCPIENQTFEFYDPVISMAPYFKILDCKDENFLALVKSDTTIGSKTTTLTIDSLIARDSIEALFLRPAWPYSSAQDYFINVPTPEKRVYFKFFAKKSDSAQCAGKYEFNLMSASIQNWNTSMEFAPSKSLGLCLEQKYNTKAPLLDQYPISDWHFNPETNKTYAAIYVNTYNQFSEEPGVEKLIILEINNINLETRILTSIDGPNIFRQNCGEYLKNVRFLTHEKLALIYADSQLSFVDYSKSPIDVQIKVPSQKKRGQGSTCEGRDPLFSFDRDLSGIDFNFETKERTFWYISKDSTSDHRVIRYFKF